MPGPSGKSGKSKGSKGSKGRSRKKGKDDHGLDAGIHDVDMFDQRFDRDEWLKKNAVHLNYDKIKRDDYDDDDLK